MSRGFLVTWGPAPTISCCDCQRGTRMVPAPDADLTVADVQRYKETHVHGRDDGRWDVPSDPLPVEESTAWI